MSYLIPCREVFKAHYGKALKAADRVKSGGVNVFGSNGYIGSHNEILFDEPTIIIGRKGSVGKVTYVNDGCWIIDTAFYIERLDKDTCDLRYLFYALKSAKLSERILKKACSMI